MKSQVNTLPSPDPRRNAGFDPELFPKCDGRAFPLDGKASDADWEIKRQFLTAYYEINLCHANLLAMKENRGRLNRSRNRGQALAEKLERAIQAKEALEDYHWASGISATPIFEGHTITDLTFMLPPPAPPAGPSVLVRFKVTPPTTPRPVLDAQSPDRS